MKLSFGDILLARFPFTDLSSDKRRPVVVLSDQDHADVVVCAVTSRPYDGRFDIPVDPSGSNGLKVRSRIQFDKIATLDRSVVAGRLGALPEEFMQRHAALFRSQFGFRDD